MDLLEPSPALICLLQGPDHLFSMANKACREVMGGQILIGRRLGDVLSDPRNHGLLTIVESVYRTGKSYMSNETPLFVGSGLDQRSGDGPFEKHYLNFFFQAVRSSQGTITGIVVHGVDITSQIRAREQAAIEDARFRIAGEAIPYGVWEAGPDGGIVYVGKKMLELLGLPLEEVSGNQWQKIIHPEDITRLAYRVTDTMPRGEPFEDEFRVLGADGQYYYVLSKGRPIHDSAGNVTSWVGIHLDINEKKRHEKELQESEQRFRSLAESSPIIIWSASPEGHTEYVNRRWNEMTGLNDDQTLGMRWADVVHPDDISRVLESWTESIRIHKPLLVETRVRGKDGKYFWLFAHARPVLDDLGRVQRWLGVGVNITERKNAEINLHQAQENLQLALDAGHMVTWELDALNILTVTGGSPHQLLGHDLPTNLSIDEFLNSVYPPDRVGIMEIVDGLKTSQNKTEFEIEFRTVWPDGSIHWVSSRSKLIQEEAGKSPVLRGVSVEITKQKEAGQELLRAKETAESANRLKTSFLANMSHEIRTPLGVIMGFSELLSGRDISEEDREKFKETILRSGRELTRLIDDILDLSKVEAGHLEIVESQISPRNLLRDVCELMNSRAKEKNIDLEIKIEGELPDEISTDPTRLKQILFNLVGNAIKFTPHGRVLLVTRALMANASSGTLEFEVSDSGVGLNSSEREKIFRPFVQADSSMTRVFGGTGLGLSLSKKIAKAMGGDVYLRESTPNRGSVFGATIPFTVAAMESPVISKVPAQETVASVPSQGRLSGLKVLLVEDSKDNQDLMKRILAKDGAVLEIADNGLEGVEKALRSSHDLVLMDIQMPKMDGLEAMQKLKSEGFATPVIALTAHAMREEKEKTLAFGFVDYITKPVSRATLVETLARYMNR